MQELTTRAACAYAIEVARKGAAKDSAARATARRRTYLVYQVDVDDRSVIVRVNVERGETAKVNWYRARFAGELQPVPVALLRPIYPPSTWMVIRW